MVTRWVGFGFWLLGLVGTLASALRIGTGIGSGHGGLGKGSPVLVSHEFIKDAAIGL